MFLKGLIFYFVFYIWTFCFFLVFSTVNLFSVNFTSNLSLFWSKSILKIAKYILGIKYEIEGLSNLPNTPIIVASNHQSAWETFFLYSILKNPRIVLKEELKKIPILSMYFKKLGFIYVNRELGLSSIKNILHKIKNKTLNATRSIIIFPEGTRVDPECKNELSTGVFVLYKNLRLPIVTIRHNSGHYWLNKNIRKKKGTIKVKIFSPISIGKDKSSVMKILENNIYEKRN